MKKLLGCVVCSALCLVSCVSVRPPADTGLSARHKQSFAQRQMALSRINHWTIAGATSVIHNKKGDSANYQWVQDGANYQIKLAGALNVGATTVRGGQGWVRVTRGSGQVYKGINANALLKDAVGWPLPVSQLVYWVRGMPAPVAYSNQQVDASGRLASLTQLGFDITWSRYVSVGAVELPRWVVMQKPGFKIKLLVRTWQVD